MKPRKVIWANEKVFIPGINADEYNRETAFQVYCAHWVRVQYELTKDSIFERWHHSANERQGGRAGFMAKMMGQQKGFPDFVQLKYRLAIELKLPQGSLSKEQQEWCNYLRSIDWKFYCIRSFEDFKETIEENRHK